MVQLFVIWIFEYMYTHGDVSMLIYKASIYEWISEYYHLQCVCMIIVEHLRWGKTFVMMLLKYCTTVPFKSFFPVAAHGPSLARFRYIFFSKEERSIRLGIEVKRASHLQLWAEQRGSVDGSFQVRYDVNTQLAFKVMKFSCIFLSFNCVVFVTDLKIFWYVIKAHTPMSCNVL